MAKIGFNCSVLEKIILEPMWKIKCLFESQKNALYLDGMRKAQFNYENESIDALWYAKYCNMIV